MPSSAAYITVAIVAIPTLIKVACLRWRPTSSESTSPTSHDHPTVALAVYAAAGIAEANAFTAGWRACWFGLGLYFIPFLLITDPL